MTEPSQYFKGRTVQEQMNEVIGYVDVRAEEVAAAKADDVLEPAEQAKDDAIAAKEAAEQARDTTLAALPAVNERIDDVESNLNAVTLRVTTAEGDIVTIQGRVTALETADGQNVKINNINQYAFGLTGEQVGTGDKQISNSNIKVFGSQAYGFICKSRWFNSEITNYNASIPSFVFIANDDVEVGRIELLCNTGVFMIRAKVRNHDGTTKTVELIKGDN